MSSSNTTWPIGTPLWIGLLGLMSYITYNRRWCHGYLWYLFDRALSIRFLPDVEDLSIGLIVFGENFKKSWVGNLSWFRTNGLGGVLDKGFETNKVGDALNKSFEINILGGTLDRDFWDRRLQLRWERKRVTISLVIKHGRGNSFILESSIVEIYIEFYKEKIFYK